VETVVLSTQHRTGISNEQIQHEVTRHIVDPVIPEPFRSGRLHCFVNPSGRFVVGGPAADTGLTGRKIVVDSYGSSCAHGGGSFSGKDPTKVDRSGAYAARYIAKNIVAAGLAQRCTVQLAYAIGRCDPVSLSLDLHDTGEVDQGRLLAAVRESFPLTPSEIIQHLDLWRPIYRKTSVYGHFGRDEPSFTWERIDKAEMLRSAFSRA
jgi:S-adenosylmethionine synthetase